MENNIDDRLIDIMLKLANDEILTKEEQSYLELHQDIVKDFTDTFNLLFGSILK